MRITPAGMTYERALEIAVASIKPVGAPAKVRVVDDEIRHLHERGWSDSAIARHLGVPRPTIRLHRAAMDLPTNNNGGREPQKRNQA